MRNRRRNLGLYLRGMAMGIAEVIPGVSGGTIAFITGIYPELLQTLAGLTPRVVPALWRDGIAAFWQRQNLGFLLLLGAGMLTSVLVFARLMHRLLEAAPTLVWAFFFGLILASCIDIGRRNTWLHLMTAGVLGIAFGMTASVLGAGAGTVTYPALFFGGMIAVVAWLLPGVSGSYILLLLGLYPAVVAAVAELELDVLAVVAAGLVTGLMLFSQLLAFLLRRWYYPLMALLTGFMAGSLLALWPWHLTVDRGPGGRALNLPVSPGRFAEATGQDPAMLAALALALLGMVAVWLLGRVGQSLDVEHEPAR